MFNRRYPGQKRDENQLRQYAQQAEDAKGAAYGSIARANDPNQYGSVASNQYPQFFGSRPAQPRVLHNNGPGMARRYDAAAHQQNISNAMAADTAFRNRVPPPTSGLAPPPPSEPPAPHYIPEPKRGRRRFNTMSQGASLPVLSAVTKTQFDEGGNNGY
jgi:hypothetical protein